MLRRIYFLKFSCGLRRSDGQVSLPDWLNTRVIRCQGRLEKLVNERRAPGLCPNDDAAALPIAVMPPPTFIDVVIENEVTRYQDRFAHIAFLRVRGSGEINFTRYHVFGNYGT